MDRVGEGVASGGRGESRDFERLVFREISRFPFGAGGREEEGVGAGEYDSMPMLSPMTQDLKISIRRGRSVSDFLKVL